MVAFASLLFFVYEKDNDNSMFVAKSSNFGCYSYWSTRLELPEVLLADKYYCCVIVQSADIVRLYIDDVFTLETKNQGTCLSMAERAELKHGAPQIIPSYKSTRINLPITKTKTDFKVQHVQFDTKEQMCRVKPYVLLNNCVE